MKSSPCLSVQARRGLPTKLVLALGVALVSCASGSEESETTMSSDNRIVRLLASGQPVFGIFSGEHTAEQGAVMGRNRETDFVFYSLEQGPFDVPQMQEYARGMRETAGESGPAPIALRIPPIRDGESVARERVREALAAGVGAVVFPHVETAAQAAMAVSAMGDDLWPTRAGGGRVNMLIVEDRAGVENAPSIASTAGVSVVFAGPGDLRRAYDGDRDAVERAIQTVLAACRQSGVPCGITAGADDIADRLAQGFRVIIVTQPEALAVGREAAGRVD